VFLYELSQEDGVPVVTSILSSVAAMTIVENTGANSSNFIRTKCNLLVLKMLHAK